MHEAKHALPTMLNADGVVVNATDWGGMTVTHMRFPAGTDLTPILRGLPDDVCPAAHWGYMLKGRVRLRYRDGREEVTEAGQVYYWPAGHTAVFEEDTEYVEFSPQQEMHQVMEHVGRQFEKAA